jgi:hypothetical protein
MPNGLLFIVASKASKAAVSYLNSITHNSVAPSLDHPRTVNSETYFDGKYPVPATKVDL